eukprot:COSAG05_NODE_468_length_9525_cov_30.402292_2_plen_186_part_00
MDGRTTGADFEAQQTREEEEAPLERLPKSRPVQRGTRVSAAAKNFGKTGGQWAVATFGEGGGETRVYGTVLAVSSGPSAASVRVQWDISVPTWTPDQGANAAAIGREWWTFCPSGVRKENKNAGIPALPLNTPKNRPQLDRSQLTDSGSEGDSDDSDVELSIDAASTDDDEEYQPASSLSEQRNT